MKQTMLTSMLIIILAACNDYDQDPQPYTDKDEPSHRDSTAHVDTSTASVQTALDDASIQFVNAVSSGGTMEIELGRQAQQTGSDPSVKAYGAMMERDHHAADDELKAIAKAKKYVFPGTLAPDHQHHIETIEKQQGKAFDAAYMTMMVKDHQKTIDLFQQTANNSQDPAIKTFATKTLPILKMHLDSAQAIVRRIGGK